MEVRAYFSVDVLVVYSVSSKCSLNSGQRGCLDGPELVATHDYYWSCSPCAIVLIMVPNGLTFHAYRGTGNIETQSDAVIRWGKTVEVITSLYTLGI
jgi:hypothetical protein